MKFPQIAMFVALAVLVLAGGWQAVHAQYESIAGSPMLLSACPAPAAGVIARCDVANDPANPAGEYATANGAPYFLLQAVAQSGVTSWNTRKGAVVPALGDYPFSLISGQIIGTQMPATTTCTYTATVGPTNTITLSGCK
jgi:hypothetical protein